MDETGMQRMETALRTAIAEHRAALRQEIERRTNDFSLRFLLARLGAPRAALDALGDPAGPAALDAALKRDLATRLCAEATRLLRLARTAHPDYDVNRHIAVRRALRWMEEGVGPAVLTPPSRSPASCGLPSGSALNGRFKRSARRRARPSPQETATSAVLP